MFLFNKSLKILKKLSLYLSQCLCVRHEPHGSYRLFLRHIGTFWKWLSKNGLKLCQQHAAADISRMMSSKQNLTRHTGGRVNLNFQATPYGVAFLNPWNHPNAVRKFSVGLVVLRKERVSKSKQTDGGYLLDTYQTRFEHHRIQKSSLKFTP